MQVQRLEGISSRARGGYRLPARGISTLLVLGVRTPGRRTPPRRLGRNRTASASRTARPRPSPDNGAIDGRLPEGI